MYLVHSRLEYIASFVMCPFSDRSVDRQGLGIFRCFRDLEVAQDWARAKVTADNE
jgi:hypothetical protein